MIPHSRPLTTSRFHLWHSLALSLSPSVRVRVLLLSPACVLLYSVLCTLYIVHNVFVLPNEGRANRRASALSETNHGHTNITNITNITNAN